MYKLCLTVPLASATESAWKLADLDTPSLVEPKGPVSRALVQWSQWPCCNKLVDPKFPESVCWKETNPRNAPVIGLSVGAHKLQQAGIKMLPETVFLVGISWYTTLHGCAAVVQCSLAKGSNVWRPCFGRDMIGIGWYWNSVSIMTPLKLMANSQGRPLSWQVLLFPCHQFLRGTVPSSGLGDQLTQGVGLSVLFWEY